VAGAVAAVAATLTNSPGWYVGDNRFEQYWSPGRLLARLPSLWDPSRGLGRPRGEFLPVTTAAMGVYRSLGASPWLTERLWHATLLVVAGLGAAALVRSLRPRPDVAVAVAGAAYAFSPVAAASLVPSALFFNYAVAPWLVVALVRGVTGARPWRWAAVFALLVFAGGSTDPPGLVYAAALLVPAGAYVALVARAASWRRLAGWLARAGALSLAVSAAVLVQVVYGAASLSARLYGTESPATVSAASSWSESWRGLGFWITYARDGGRLVRPQHSAWFDSAPIVLATFAVPVAALAALALSRWRARLLFGAFAFVGLVAMVGSYPPDHPSIAGRLLLDAYDAVPSLTALRNTYKAGFALALGLAGLLGGAAALAAGRLAGRRLLAGVAAGLAVGLFAVAAFPFWTGGLYSTDNRTEKVPGYWRAAVAWLDARPGDARVLVEPGTFNSRYRWGSPGDDLFDALLARPHVVRTSLPLSTAEASDLVLAVDDRLQSGDYRPGTIGPIARRLGIGYVLVRNDLDWQRLGRARPADLQPLRDDPDLEPVATFGDPGEHTVAAGDDSPEAEAERRLPPVEVFAVAGVDGQARLTGDRPLLLSGSGEGWFTLAADDLLGTGGPVRSTASTEPGVLAGDLAGGASLVVTDSNRRTVTLVTGSGSSDSHTLAAGEQLGRPANDLFGTPGSQTVAWFADATSVASASAGAGLAGYEPEFRPANAFDGDPHTAWMTGGYQDPLGRSVLVRLRRPTTVSSVEVDPAVLFGAGRTIRLASLHFSDGSSVPVDLSRGSASVGFPARSTTSLELRIDALSGPGVRPVGFAEVRVPGLDLTEWVQAPDDAFRAADTTPAVAAALGTAPVAYAFERQVGDGARPVERALRRRFRTAATRPYDLTAVATATETTPDRLLDELVGGDVGAVGSTRYLGRLDGWGGLAVDDSLDTGWAAYPTSGSTIEVRFPEQTVNAVGIVTDAGPSASAVTSVRVAVGDVLVEAPVLPSAECGEDLSSPACRGEVYVTVPAATVDRVTVAVQGLSPRSTGGLDVAPTRILDVEIGPVGLDRDGERSGGPCVDGVVTLDGSDVPVRLAGDAGDLLDGRPVAVEACEDVRPPAGWHRLAAGGDVAVDRLTLSTADAPVVPPGSPPEVGSVEALERSPWSARLLVDAPDGGVVVPGQSFDAGWSATVDGEDAGPPRSTDTQNGWVVPAGEHVVEVRYRPQRVYGAALAVTAAAVALCLWLAARRERPA
jgi:arabinofuranan 3-O-arabinosyltransferase